MPTPSPGTKNGGGAADLGPVIRKVTKNPERPDLAIAGFPDHYGRGFGKRGGGRAGGFDLSSGVPR